MPRLQRGSEDNENCYPEIELDGWAARAQEWAKGGQPHDLPCTDPTHRAEIRPRDVFVYFIAGGKPRAPFGAMALHARVGS